MHFHRRIGNFHPRIFLRASPVQFGNEVKFLDLTFYPKLTWLTHAKQLKTTTTKTLGILRVLSHLSWGADRTALLPLFRRENEGPCSISRSKPMQDPTSWHPQVHPWTNPVELDIVEIGKKGRANMEIKQRFLEYTSKHKS